MNISYNWLKEYLNFNLTPEELADALTSIGLETGSVEEVESIRGGLRGVTIGKVLTCVEHPDSDHLHITTVDLGLDNPVQIVCGAPNVAAGQTVVVATVGTKLYDGDKEFQIKKSKIRGAESNGMICAEDEIGIGESHDGIIVLKDEIAPGTPAAKYFGLESDFVLEVDLTPNRIDAASHYGVARDLSAWLKRHTGEAELKRPSIDSFKSDTENNAIDVAVEDTKLCPRYSGITIRNIKVGPSPKWLKDKLIAIGQRPINNVVDITNYILHGFAQPLHSFDLDKITGGKIIVKTCPEGTKFTTLDGQERTLDSNDLMICDTEKPLCIAGVFGGLNSGVTEETTSIFLESAYFNPTSIRKTARRHGLNTDASFRFERGIDPNGTMYALKLAAMLIKELAGGEICGAPVDIYPNPISPAEVTLKYKYANNLIGKEIGNETIENILRSLEFDIIRKDTESIGIKVPTYRVDVKRECDVVEDILRIYGYNNVEISDTLKASLSYRNTTDLSNALKETISNQLTACGFNEIMNNSLTSESYYSTSEEFPLKSCVRLLNPLSSDLSVMRRTLLYGGLETISHNINRKFPNLYLYEFGNVYTYTPGEQPTDESPLRPYREQHNLGIWLTGSSRSGNWIREEEKTTFFDLKGVVANILARLGINEKEIKLTPVNTEIFSSALEISTKSGKNIGRMGIISKKILKESDIKQEVYYAELNWNALIKIASGKKTTYTPLPRTQPVKRDLALLIDEAVTMAQIEGAVRESEKRLLKDITLFDVYEGKNLPVGKKSYAISITLQDDDNTLTDHQIETVMDRIVKNLTNKINATLR